MRRIIYPINNGLAKFPLEFIEYIQQGIVESLDSLMQMLNSGSTPYILYGCAVTKTGTTYTWTSGAIYYAGEIYRVTGSSLVVPTGTPTWSVDDGFGPVVPFLDGSNQNVLSNRTVTLTALGGFAAYNALSVWSPLQGPKGDKGDTGNTGATGPQGPAGLTIGAIFNKNSENDPSNPAGTSYLDVSTTPQEPDSSSYHFTTPNDGVTRLWDIKAAVNFEQSASGGGDAVWQVVHLEIGGTIVARQLALQTGYQIYNCISLFYLATIPPNQLVSLKVWKSNASGSSGGNCQVRTANMTAIPFNIS